MCTFHILGGPTSTCREFPTPLFLFIIAAAAPTTVLSADASAYTTRCGSWLILSIARFAVSSSVQIFILVNELEATGPVVTDLLFQAAGWLGVGALMASASDSRAKSPLRTIIFWARLTASCTGYELGNVHSFATTLCARCLSLRSLGIVQDSTSSDLVAVVRKADIIILIAVL